MRKTIYCLFLVILTLPLMAYGWFHEQANLTDNGQTLLMTVVPAFNFLLGNVFILMFDKEDKAPIILATSLAITFFTDLITLGYYDLRLSDLNGGLAVLIAGALIQSLLTWASLTLYVKTKKPQVHLKH